MSKVDKDQVIEEFTQAYQKAHGKTPTIEAKSGWYSVDGGKNMRIGQLQDMIAELNGSAKTESKPAPAKKKAAAKPAKAKKPAKSGGFSVKAYYAEKLKDDNPGAILPR